MGLLPPTFKVAPPSCFKARWSYLASFEATKTPTNGVGVITICLTHETTNNREIDMSALVAASRQQVRSDYFNQTNPVWFPTVVPNTASQTYLVVA
jgi:hypothetical protein